MKQNRQQTMQGDRCLYRSIREHLNLTGALAQMLSTSVTEDHRKLDDIIEILGNHLHEFCDLCGNHRSVHYENRCPEVKLENILAAKARKKEIDNG